MNHTRTTFGLAAALLLATATHAATVGSEGPDLGSAPTSSEPQPEPSTCPLDMDANGGIDFGDLLVVLRYWGACPDTLGEGVEDCPADIDNDGMVGFRELIQIVEHIGRVCPDTLGGPDLGNEG